MQLQVLRGAAAAATLRGLCSGVWREGEATPSMSPERSHADLAAADRGVAAQARRCCAPDAGSPSTSLQRKSPRRPAVRLHRPNRSKADTA